MVDETDLLALEAACRARGAVVVEVDAMTLARLLAEVRALRDGREEWAGGDR